MNKVTYVISNSGSITVFVTGRPYNIASDHPNYAKIVSALKSQTFDVVADLIDVGKAIINFSKGEIKITNGEILYKGFTIKNSLTERIQTLMNMELPFEPLINFFNNIMENPSARSVDETFNFLDCNSLPITEDGCFLAYKRVRDDFKDFYTGTVDNSIGASPSMPRNLVDDNSANTCSRGLHFCSKEYLKHYHGGCGRIIAIKVNPKNVVSIPTEYRNSKGRCCGYDVLYEITNDVDEHNDKQEYFKNPLYDVNGKVAMKVPYHNVRDKATGRFAKKS